MCMHCTHRDQIMKSYPLIKFIWVETAKIAIATADSFLVLDSSIYSEDLLASRRRSWDTRYTKCSSRFSLHFPIRSKNGASASVGTQLSCSMQCSDYGWYPSTASKLWCITIAISNVFRIIILHNGCDEDATITVHGWYTSFQLADAVIPRRLWCQPLTICYFHHEIHNYYYGRRLHGSNSVPHDFPSPLVGWRYQTAKREHTQL